MLAASGLLAQSATFTVVNAASYGGTLAPDALATIFGSNLAQATASATLDANGQLPTELASTKVEINGVAAALFYVSPGQINLVIPSGLDAGTATVLIRSTLSGATKSGTALLAASAPGVFTSDASGSGAGAILNAVTYQPAPFLVLTPSTGADSRTRLAVYGTGFRHAAAVKALAQDTTGNRYTLTVEYAGAAPGFFGLDQVNLLLPADVDGAGAVSLSLMADTIAANVVTFQIDQIPASALALATVTISAALVSAGDSPVVTVGLNGVARSGGFVVGLRSDNAAAQVESQITILAGKASAPATVTTSTVSDRTFALITAQAGTMSKSVSLAIDPVGAIQIAALYTSAASVLGGKSLTGTVTLNGSSPGNFNIVVSSDNASVRDPGQVAVPFGKSSADFIIATQAVTSVQTVTLTAAASRSSATAQFTVLPALQLALNASAVEGGTSVSGTVTLAEVAPATGATVTLRASDPAVQVPTVTISAGQSAQTFTLNTLAVTAARTVSISATYGLASAQAVSLTVNPPAARTAASLTISPNPVTHGSKTQGTVTLSGATGSGGVRVDLQSSNALTALPSPNFLIIAQGQSSGTFTITTSGVGTVTFTATAGGVSKTASLTVQ